MTESFPICSNPPSLKIKLSTVGPAMGPHIKILAGHPEDVELPIGTEGEVCVAGACVTGGYLMRDHMSQDPNIEAFSLPSSSVGRMLRTGDKGYLDANGYLQLVGRFKEIINCGEAPRA
jgi:acyl-CoA synthetase (AMP-forming)/AMP-acid ligase II